MTPPSLECAGSLGTPQLIAPQYSASSNSTDEQLMPKLPSSSSSSSSCDVLVGDYRSVSSDFDEISGAETTDSEHSSEESSPKQTSRKHATKLGSNNSSTNSISTKEDDSHRDLPAANSSFSSASSTVSLESNSSVSSTLSSASSLSDFSSVASYSASLGLPLPLSVPVPLPIPVGVHVPVNKIPYNGRNLHIDNLPPMTDSELRSLFSPYGSIESVRVVTDSLTGQHMGYGFVMFATSEEANRAMEAMQDRKVGGKELRVTLARQKPKNGEPLFPPNTNLYCAGLPDWILKKELDAMFAPFGTILESRVLLDRTTGESRGVGFVRFDNTSACNAAIRALNGTIPPLPPQVVVARSAAGETDAAASVEKESVAATSSSSSSTAGSESSSPSSLPVQQPITVRYAVDKSAQQNQLAFQIHQNPHLAAHLAVAQANANAAKAAWSQNNSPTSAPGGLNSYNGSPHPHQSRSQVHAQAQAHAQAQVTAALIQRNYGSPLLTSLPPYSGTPYGINRVSPPLLPTTSYSTNAGGLMDLSQHHVQAQAQAQAQVQSAGLMMGCGYSPPQTSSGFSSPPPFLSAAGYGHPLSPVFPNSTSPPPASNLPRASDGLFPLFVYHLPHSFSDPELLSLFSQCGIVLSCTVIRDLNTGASRGFGFVNMLNYEDALRSIQNINGLQIGNKTLKVEFKK